MCSNPKIESSVEHTVRKYTFKPFYNIKNRKDLINLVKEQQAKAAGGILLEDIQESLPNADEILKVSPNLTYSKKLKFFSTKKNFSKIENR